jgi:hypothetical protein
MVTVINKSSSDEFLEPELLSGQPTSGQTCFGIGLEGFATVRQIRRLTSYYMFENSTDAHGMTKKNNYRCASSVKFTEHLNPMEQPTLRCSPEAASEIERHKYFLSEEAGFDVGWEFAERDWEEKYGRQFRQDRADNGQLVSRGIGPFLRRLLSKCASKNR